MWLQAINYLLNTNGFGHLWHRQNFTNLNLNFHKLFKMRLNDQFSQMMRDKITTSTRFTTLKLIYGDDGQNNTYIHIIRSPDIRTIFLRLRIDMNVLSTSRSNTNILITCPLCSQEPETVCHFLLYDSRYLPTFSMCHLPRLYLRHLEYVE